MDTKPSTKPDKDTKPEQGSKPSSQRPHGPGHPLYRHPPPYGQKEDKPPEVANAGRYL